MCCVGGSSKAGAEADAAKWEAELATAGTAQSSEKGASGSVECPVCGSKVLAEHINAHIDSGCAAHIIRYDSSIDLDAIEQANNTVSRVGKAHPTGRRPIVKKASSGSGGSYLAGVRLKSGAKTGVTAGVDLFKSGEEMRVSSVSRSLCEPHQFAP